MKQPEKILIIGPAWIGDMVMAQTLFKLLKQRNPNNKIDVLAPKWTLPVVDHMPEINNTIVAPFNHGELNLLERYKLGKQLQREKYSQAIVLPNSFKSALIPFWAKIPIRTGWAKELRSILLNDSRKLNKTKLPLMIQRFAALAFPKNSSLPEQLPWPKLITKKSNHKKDQKILALCPGAEYGPAKRWPAKHFATIAKQKLKDGWQVMLFGGPKDESITQEIQSLTNNKCTDMAGKTSLTEAIDLLAEATVVISNDTGLMHIAAALDKPLIVIYGSSSPGFTPPLSNRAKILSLQLECSPCFERECPLGHLKCLNNLTPEVVLNSLNNIVITYQK